MLLQYHMWLTPLTCAVFKGVPRKGNSFFTSDAEIVNGRLAMVGFLG